MKGLIWLASYPKSGNTWFRIFLANLMSEGEKPVDINLLNTHNWRARRTFDPVAGWDTSLLTPEEIRVLGLQVQRSMAKQRPFTILKAHDAFTAPDGDREIFCRDSMGAVIYLIRNPLDVAVSFSHHLNQPLDQTIALMNRPKGKLGEMKTRIYPGLPDQLRDWSGHASSWAEAKGIPLKVIRYEDLRQNPLREFCQACAFLGINKSQAEIARAMANSSFEVVKKQEMDHGFREAGHQRPFFRKGTSGGWGEALSQEQMQSIIRSHGEMMRRFGYLDEQMRPV
ncbi:MAG: sulfotransferase [Verrucomicrobiales bacterium]|nr:sulfotransferase [Verrucomicrobiales bacterium]